MLSTCLIRWGYIYAASAIAKKVKWTLNRLKKLKRLEYLYGDNYRYVSGPISVGHLYGMC